jgi:hypothetical protein
MQSSVVMPKLAGTRTYLARHDRGVTNNSANSFADKQSGIGYAACV